MDRIIRRTEDHSIFKHLTGNRGVKRTQVEKIKQSISKVGYVTNPIIVNEFYQIIDGQGREQALAEFGLPVDFIVVEGLGIDECRAMNINQSNWTIIDYIRSYAEQGDPSYMRFKQLLESYKPHGIDYRVATCVLTKGFGQYSSVKLMNGDLIFSDADLLEAVKCLDYVSLFVPLLDERNCKSYLHYLSVLVWVFYRWQEGDTSISPELLYEKTFRHKSMLTPVVNAEQAAEVLEAIYDYRLSAKQYLRTSYLKSITNYKKHRKSEAYMKGKNKCKK